MFSFPAQTRVFLAVNAVDMRKSFDSLWAEAVNHLHEDPFEGSLFVFSNRMRNRIKILYWDGTGVWVFAKRLEKGRFSWPASSGGKKLVIEPSTLSLILAGIEPKKCYQKSWFSHKNP